MKDFSRTKGSQKRIQNFKFYYKNGLEYMKLTYTQ